MLSSPPRPPSVMFTDSVSPESCAVATKSATTSVCDCLIFEPSLFAKYFEDILYAKLI